MSIGGVNNNVNNEAVKTKTITRKVNGEKQEIVITFGKNGQKTYSTKDGKEIYVKNNPLLGKKSFTTENPEANKNIAQLTVGQKGLFKINGQTVKGTVMQDQSGSNYIEATNKTDNGSEVTVRYAQNSDGELGVTYRRMLKPDGSGIEYTYKDGERIQNNIAAPKQNVAAETNEQAKPEQNEFANLLEEVNVTGDASKVKFNGAGVLSSIAKMDVPDKLNKIEIKQQQPMDYEKLMAVMNEKGGAIPDLREGGAYLDQGQKAYYSLEQIGGSTQFLNTVGPDGNKYLAHKYNDDGVIGLHVLNDEGKVTTPQKLMYPDGRIEDFEA